MWAWPKKNHEPPAWRSLARPALAGAARQDLLQEVLHAAASGSRADRVGVWLWPDSPADAESSTLHGVVWEREEEQVPAEWERLSWDSPVPHDLLLQGRSVEQELDRATRPMFGLLIGLHRVLWTPVPGRERLRGVFLTGWQKSLASVPREFMESLAAELAVALELEEQLRLTRERASDLRLSQEVLCALSSGASTDTVLSRLAADCADLCTAPSSAGFAVLGHFPPVRSGSRADPELEFDWESGDATWTHGIDREPLAGIWRQALESGRTSGIEPPASWSASGLARLVAIPLNEGERQAGVLVCGMAPASSSLRTLERLELRASLALAALERRRFNAERLRRTARRQSFLDSSAEPTLLVDVRGTIAAVNGAARPLVEEAPTDPSPSSGPATQAAPTSVPWCIGGGFAQIFCAREQPRVEEWWNRAMASDRAAPHYPVPSLEAELLTGVRVRLHPPLAVGDDLAAVMLDPVPSHAVAPQHDRWQTELHQVLEWVEEGILIFGTDQLVRGMNTRFAQMAGLSAEEASSCSTLDDLIRQLGRRAAQPEAFALRWRELARSSEAGAREEVQMSRPVPRILERSVRPILDSAGLRLGRLEIYRDLTAQRVFQAKLLQTEKLAALGQMITGVAHELSNPLTSILGYAQRLLVRKDLSGRSTEARQIYEEAERASAILRQLLLTARDTQPERKRVALNQVVQRAMELQRFGSAAEKIRIELDLDPALPFVLGDAGQLQQVLMNLIGNARQAIAQESRPGTIRLRTTRTGEYRVQLQVIDDGPGIPQAILARIFDPFFTTKPAGVGTGLGLSIVLSVVREHGGQVHVANSSGGGAVFTVELPVAAEAPSRSVLVPEGARPVLPAAIGSRSRPPLSEIPVARASHRGTHVLVVEDEPTVARLIADVLEDEAMRVDVLLDGREALARATREPFDLIICDMKMPGIDGQHFYHSLAQTQAVLQDRFLFVTGDVLAPQTQEFLERNHIPYVAKPFRVEELTERIHRLLDAHWTRAEGAAAGKQTH